MDTTAKITAVLVTLLLVFAGTVLSLSVVMGDSPPPDGSATPTETPTTESTETTTNDTVTVTPPSTENDMVDCRNVTTDEHAENCYVPPS